MSLKTKYLVLLNLATTSALTTVENEIPNISNLVKKADYVVEISEIEKNILNF